MKNELEYELKEQFTTQQAKVQELDESYNMKYDEEEEYRIAKKKVLLLGYSFMILFVGYGTCTSLISGLYKSLDYTNLGLMSLFFTYFLFAFGSFVAKGIVEKLSFNLVFMFSNLGYTSCIASGIWVFLCNGSDQTGMCSVELIYFIVNFTASLCGLCAATLWVAQGGYVEIVSKTCPNKSGTLIGLFFSFMASSSVVGSVLASFLLSIFGNMSYFILNSLLSLLSAYLMYTLPSPYSPNYPQSLRIKSTSKPLKEQISEVMDLFKNPKALYITPFYWLQGMVVGCYASYLFVIVDYSLTPEQSQNTPQYVSYVVIFLGISGVVSGFICGKLADKFDPYVLGIGASLICTTAVILSLLGLVVKQYALCFGIAILWGSCDSINSSLSVIIGSRDFPGQMQIYSLQKLVSSLACSFTLIIGIVLDGFPPYLILLIVFAFQAIATICLGAILSLKTRDNKI